MKTIAEVLKRSIDFLNDRNISHPRRIVQTLLSSVLRLEKMDLYLQFDKPLLEKELDQLRALLKRAAQHEPVEYLLGVVEFLGCQIKVSADVLIPRPETEVFVDLIAKQIETGVVWDLCTGSGCIGIALKKARPDLQVILSDISEKALQIAAQNAKDNQVDVLLVQGDLLEPFRGQKADYIICNPPYVSEKEYQGLDKSVKDFEPKLALVSGATGKEIYERLQKELFSYLKPGGKAFFEIGSRQGEDLKKLFPQGELHLDWAGLPRFFFVPNC